jgi:molecular chaperone GrpE
MAENDNTVKRYKSEIEKTKSFAISKFAKDLLDVRDSLGLADKHLNMTEGRELSDIDEIKKKFENVAEGMTMTSKIMDHTFQRYGIEEFNPMGDKFDTSVHEAVFMIPKHEKY